MKTVWKKTLMITACAVHYYQFTMSNLLTQISEWQKLVGGMLKLVSTSPRLQLAAHRLKIAGLCTKWQKEVQNDTRSSWQWLESCHIFSFVWGVWGQQRHLHWWSNSMPSHFACQFLCLHQHHNFHAKSPYRCTANSIAVYRRDLFSCVHTANSNQHSPAVSTAASFALRNCEDSS